MKLIVLTLVLNFVSIKSYVTNTTKSDMETTVFPANKTVYVYMKSSEKPHIPKTFDLNKGHVYIEDVVFSLTNHNWTRDEEPCLNKTLLLLHSLQNFTLWAVWNWDSVSSQPQGLLYGNSYHLGNFDECMNPPWYDDYPDLRSQYCLADVVLEGPDNAVKKRTSYPYDPYQSAFNFLRYKSKFQRTLNELVWGMCIPEVCHPKSVEKLVSVMLTHSHLGAAGMKARINVSECQQKNQGKPYDAVFYSFIATVTILTALCLICTYLNREKKNLEKISLRDNLISAFDMRLNAGELLRCGQHDIQMFYGIKFLTMCFITIGHQNGALNSALVSNALHIDKAALSLLGSIFMHNDLAVDTFFMISGFLFASALSELTRLPNVLLLILRRYIRIIVAYAFVIFFICSIYPYTGSGPLWPRLVSAETGTCRRNWWLNLIMLSNYLDTENMCTVVSWYIPCDFHYFVLTLLLFCIYRRIPSVGRFLFIIITVAAIITPGIINYVYKLQATLMFTYDFLKDPRASKQFHLTYIKSHTRYAAYLVGFLSGWCYTHYTSSQQLKKISLKYAVTGTCIGFLMMGAVLFTGPMFLWRSNDALENAIYAALNRPVWACGLTVVVVCCSLGGITLIKNFLCWYPFVPLSKLTYGLYLVHNFIILRNINIARNPHHYDMAFMLLNAIGTIAEGTFIAFLIWVFIEAPVKNIFKICITCGKREHNKNSHNSQNDANSERGRSPGHFQENLPRGEIEIISSKI
ncbi:nose resistant to fluoxetine protein 6-like [Danaus plexippus]|uniref:nose resistant to fluoxetine protein 6-like n=1 Tax=Danaus plexippus TaxID=13037 RepID=UPI002AB25FCC|nr:nose resistant to fluoxetine protein 6-like [Danaus plexippus]